MINPFIDEYFKKKRIESLERIIPEVIDPDKIITMPKVNGISLNLINSDIKKTISKSGYYFTPYYKKGNILLQHYSRPIGKNLDYKKKILIQPIDGTKISKNHIHNINSYDIIITPSNIGKNIMIENGITKPIIVIPNYYSDVEPSDYYEKSDKFTFYSESTGIIRKNIPNLLKYFLETFSSKDNVKLIIKTSSDRIDDLHDILNNYSDKPEISIITDHLSESDLESIMSNIDCYICLSYMEGFCIPIINALKWGKKVIALNTEISGYGDFLTNENAYLIECKRIPIDKKYESLLIWDEESEWEEPDYEHYRLLLKQAITDNSKISVDISRYSKYNVMNEYNIVINGNIEMNIENNTKTILICSIIRNRESHISTYYSQIKNIVESFPEYNFLLSVYENDSTDLTKKILQSKDWSFVENSIVCENIGTEYFNSENGSKERVYGLAIARNKALEAKDFLQRCDYVLHVEGDVKFEIESISNLFYFSKIHNFDVLSGVSFMKKNMIHYDKWGTRKYNMSDQYRITKEDIKKGFERYYATSNGLCLYNAEPFKIGARYNWYNKTLGHHDCEMVVICDEFRRLGFDNIFINYNSKCLH